MLDLKRIGRWKSDSCVEGYVENSEDLKNKRASGILGEKVEAAPKRKEKPAIAKTYQAEMAAPTSSSPKMTEPREDAHVSEAPIAAVPTVQFVLPANPPVASPSRNNAQIMAAAIPENKEGAPIFQFFFGAK